MKKYEIVSDDYITVSNRRLYRIKALKSFSDIKEGDLGGYVESYNNLSQYCECWLYDKAKAYGNAKVFDYARIKDYAEVFGNATVSEDAIVYENAKVFDSADVRGSARVHGNSMVSGGATVSGKASVHGHTSIYEYAEIFGKAEASGRAILCGNAKVCQRMYITSCVRVTTDLTKDKKMSIVAQCNLPVIDNKVVAYKIVNDDLTSLYDKRFRYRVGEIAEEEYTDEDESESCSTGLHFSHLTYWTRETTQNTYLEAEIDLDDIVAVQEGKIRCRKAKILRSFKL